jgi:hypothetical protein
MGRAPASTAGRAGRRATPRRGRLRRLMGTSGHGAMPANPAPQPACIAAPFHGLGFDTLPLLTRMSGLGRIGPGRAHLGWAGPLNGEVSWLDACRCHAIN